MTAANPSQLEYHTVETEIISIMMEICNELWPEECHVLQGGQDTAPEASPVVEQHDKGFCSETVDTEISSTDSSKAPTASTAPNDEIQSESQGGATLASSGTVTWSRQENALLVCLLCSYSTKYASRQIKHIRTYTGECPFSCDQCPQSFKRRSHLELQRRTHTGHQPYICIICAAVFTTAVYLNRHMHIHSQLPFKYVACSNQFDDTSSFIHHLGRHLK